MSTEYGKGQGIIFLVVMAMGSLMVAGLITVMILFLNGPLSQSTTVEVNHRVAETSFASASNVVMSDYMWRAPGIEKGDYHGFKAYKVVSYYFSTDEELLLDHETLSRSEVRQDIIGYLEYKMERELGLFSNGYYVRIRDPDTDESIEAGDFNRIGRKAQIEFPIAVSGGDHAMVTMVRRLR